MPSKRLLLCYSFRDLNKNGKQDVYEDKRQPIEARINDLLKQMTLEEKAGMMWLCAIKKKMCLTIVKTAI